MAAACGLSLSQNRRSFCFSLPRATVFHERSYSYRFLIEDDVSVQRRLKSLIRSVGLQVELFGTADEFITAGVPMASCLVLDCAAARNSGLELQKELTKANHQFYHLYHGARRHSYVGASHEGGRVEFLTKPFRDQDLLDAVKLALDRDRSRRHQEANSQN